MGELDHARDYLHLDDACSALVTVIEKPAPRGHFRALNAGSGVATSARQIIALLASILDTSPTIAVDASRLRPDEAPEERTDITRLRELGWMPRISQEAGLRSLWESS